MAEVTVIMVPGWETRILVEAFPFQVRITEDVADDVRQDIGAHHYVTGELYRSVHQEGNRVFIGSDHWHFVEYGTRPHRIEVRDSRVLTDRSTIFGTYVNHPGTAEFRPMRKAIHTRRALRG